MTEQGYKTADSAVGPKAFDESDSPWTSGGHRMQLAPANIHAQIAAGAPLNVTSGFTLWPTGNGNMGYSLEAVVGAGGVACTITIVGTWGGLAQTDTITVTAAGTFEGTKPFDIGGVTSVTSNIDPVGTVDIKTLDLFAYRAARGVYSNTGGDLYVQLFEDTNDTLYKTSTGGALPAVWKRIRCSKSSGRAAGISPSTADVTVAR